MGRHWNRQLSPGGAAFAWRLAGGNWHHQVVAVAVGLAESSLRRYAISPSADYGVWQINHINFGWTGLNGGNWFNPVANGHAAVLMSHNGTNWAAWCTCWRDPAQNCGHGYLPYPQVGSPAYNQIAYAQQAIGSGGQTTGGGGGGSDPRYRNPRNSRQWNYIQGSWQIARYTMGHWARQHYSYLNHLEHRAERLRRK